MPLLTIDQLVNLNLADVNLTEYAAREVKNKQTLLTEVKKFHPAEILFKVYQSQIDAGYIHDLYADVYLTGYEVKLKISINSRGSKKWYSVSCPDAWNLPHTDHHDRSSAKKAFKEPQNIGVLTLKKLTDHIEYERLQYHHLVEISKNRASEEEQFLAKLEGLPVRWGNDRKSGYISKNGLEYSFQISNGHISQRIELRSYTNSIEAFLQLSDNKFSK